MNFDIDFFNRLEFFLSSIGVILGFFSGVFLLVYRYKKANVFLAVYVLALSIRIMKSLFHNYYTISTQVLTLFLGVLLVVGPSLFYYANNLSKTNYIVKYYKHYIPFILLICVYWFLPNTYGIALKIIYFTFFLHGLVYCFFTLNIVLKATGEGANLFNDKEKRNWLLAIIFATVVFFINAILILFNVVPYYPSGASIFTIFMLFFVIWAPKNLWLFEKGSIKYSNSNLSVNDGSVYMQKLNLLMEKEKVFLNPELTLAKLSSIVGISSKQLSQVINQIENKNYSEYIAAYRVEEAKRLLADPAYKNYKIAAIAYESGFNSISSFNLAFKKQTKKTAMAYRTSVIEK